MKPKKLNFSEMKNALSRSEMKNIMAGSGPNYWCNVYCGAGAGGYGMCSGSCRNCEDAGNGRGSGPGQDKLCA